MSDTRNITTEVGAAQADPPSGLYGLEITEITISPTSTAAPVRAYVRVVLNDSLVVAQLRVVEGKKGLFVAMPTAYNRENGVRRGICYPIRRDLHEYLSREILREFRALAEAGGEG